MKIDIRQHKGTYRMREDGQFVCVHPEEEVRIDEPDYFGGAEYAGFIEGFGVWCFACQNKDMEDWQRDELVAEAYGDFVAEHEYKWRERV